MSLDYLYVRLIPDLPFNFIIMRCIIVDDESISTELLADFILRTNTLNLIGRFSDAQSALKFYNQNPKNVDLIFLDIGLPDISGLDMLESIENPPQIIIVSGSEKHALASYKYAITDYLLKPISYGRFFVAVSKALNRSSSKKEEQCEFLDTCPLFFGRLMGKETTISAYKKKYCTGGATGKTACKRYQTSARFGKCPPDLLPNSELTLDEIGNAYNLKANWNLK